MPVPVVAPDEQTLRAFLLGKLPEERVALVRAWLDSAPFAADGLHALLVDDDFVAALTEAARRHEPMPLAVERLLCRSLPPHTYFGSTPGDIESTPAPFDPAAGRAPLTLAAVPDWAPARLGGFLLLRELGHGGMGYVFEAEDERIQRRVAIKILHPKMARRPNAADRFLREARAAAAVEHENVVRVLHVGEENGTPFIVMPLLKGESLEHRLARDKTLAADEVVRIGVDIAAALAAAHATGLIHRDLKPGNVWLDEKTGRAIVLDFGLARLNDNAPVLTRPGAVVGTPAYIAPEQIDGKTPDPRADLFSLGATLYECCTGRRAFQGPSLTAVLNAVAVHNPPAPASVNAQISAALSDLILQLLAKKPDERPKSASAVHDALSAFMDGATITRTGPRVRLGRRRLVMGGMLGAILVLIFGLWLANRPTAKTDPPALTKLPDLPAPIRYRGKVDVLVERIAGGKARLLRLNEPGALPLKASDKFRIEGDIEPAAYLYLVWVDPDRDVTPVYPWDPRTGWGSRPSKEQPIDRISLPANVGNRYTAPVARPGVATMVLLARATPLEATDEEIKAAFESLPELPLPAGGDGAAVWFDNFIEARDPLRLRTFGEVGSDDAFARWQGELQRIFGGQISFQTAVSFARTGAK